MLTPSGYVIVLVTSEQLLQSTFEVIVDVEANTVLVLSCGGTKIGARVVHPGAGGMTAPTVAMQQNRMVLVNIFVTMVLGETWKFRWQDEDSYPKLTRDPWQLLTSDFRADDVRHLYCKKRCLGQVFLSLSKEPPERINMMSICEIHRSRVPMRLLQIISRMDWT